MGLVLITPPPVEPVSLAELKQYLRVDAGDTSQDSLILSLAQTGRSEAEVFTRKRFVQQTWRLYMDFFPGYIDLKIAGAKISSPFVSGSNAVLVGIRYAILLPYPPVNSILGFQYQDANGTATQMVQGSDYIADLMSNPARLTPLFGKMWPVARVVINAVQIDYSLGYAIPLTVTTAAASATVQSSSYQFQISDIGRPISIPFAGPESDYAPSGETLNTVITAVGSPPNGTATLRDKAGNAASGVGALLVNAPAGNPAHWEMIKNAIKLYVSGKYENRLPDADVIGSFQNALWPVRDLRM